MSLTIPTRLVKICHWKSCTCFFFAYHDCVLSRSIYCSKRYADSIIEPHEKRAFHRIQGNQAFFGWGDLDTAQIYLLQVTRSHRAIYSAFIIWIRCKDGWIPFSEKGHHPKFVKRKWKIENSDKEEVQFQTQQKAPVWRAYEERKNFPPTIEKCIQLAAVR